MSFESSSHNSNNPPTSEQLYQLAEVGWRQREQRVRTTLESMSLTGDEVEKRLQYIHGYPYDFKTTVKMASGEAERRRTVSLELSWAAFNGASLWLACRDEVLVEQSPDVPLARVATVHQFLWNKDTVLHAQRHDELSDKLGKTGEFAPLDRVSGDLGVHDDEMTFAFMNFEEQFGRVSSAECVYLVQSLEQHYNQVRLRSDNR